MPTFVKSRQEMRELSQCPTTPPESVQFNSFFFFFGVATTKYLRPDNSYTMKKLFLIVLVQDQGANKFSSEMRDASSKYCTVAAIWRKE